MKILLEDDMVDLVIVTPHNFLPVGRVARKEAMRLIKSWYEMRDRVKEEDPEAVERLKYGTITGGYLRGNGEVIPNQWAVAWDSVIAIYIRDPVESSPPQSDMQKKLSKLIDKTLEGFEEGEEWKNEDSRD